MDTAVCHATNVYTCPQHIVIAFTVGILVAALTAHPVHATQDERLRAQKAAERVAAIKTLQAEMRDRATLLRELRTTSNRGVERAHTRLAREHSKANQDARARRMDALKVPVCSVRNCT